MAQCHEIGEKFVLEMKEKLPPGANGARYQCGMLQVKKEEPSEGDMRGPIPQRREEKI